jgi:hypothetical protein
MKISTLKLYTMKLVIIPLSILLAVSCGNTRKGNQTLPVVTETNTPESPIKKIENIPSCLAEQLNKIQARQYDSPPVSIDEYEYNGRKVYLFTSECCDQYDILFDENCKGFCAPSGGITGKGDGKCTDFKEKARLIRNIWKK